MEIIFVSNWVLFIREKAGENIYSYNLKELKAEYAITQKEWEENSKQFSIQKIEPTKISAFISIFEIIDEIELERNLDKYFSDEASLLLQMEKDQEIADDDMNNTNLFM